ncbi:MAG: polysaccharide biosynthesis protein [Rhodospirillales bacterium]|nr:polysaccharide biosynthesis protein [Rhodospirillales bacterium]
MIKSISNRGHFAYAHDLVMAFASFWLAIYLRIADDFIFYDIDELIPISVVFTVICAIVFRVSGLYRGVWRYASITDLWAIIKAVSFVILIFAFVMFLWTRLETLPRSILIINWFILMAMLGGPRFFYRLLKDRRFDLSAGTIDSRQIPVLLAGASDGAELFIRSLRQNQDLRYRVVGIASENRRRIGQEIHGIPVLGTVNDLAAITAQLTADNQPQRVILTKDDMDGGTVRSILEQANGLGLTLSRTPKLTDFKSSITDQLDIRPVDVEDLLGRAQTPLDRNAMRLMLEGKTVLITGAGGSIGSELVRQVCDFNPRSVTLVENSEFALYSIDLEVSQKWPSLVRHAIIADVREKARIQQIMIAGSPDLVFHAAALKHVPLVEANVCEGLATNVIGTRNVADACVAAQVSTMVVVSTDKAINPTNIMGASKRLAEIYCQALDLDPDSAPHTQFVTVRFGNVLGSTGSVVPLFQKQLVAGGPLTVTHPDMTRYFMTIREAVELILQSATLGRQIRDSHDQGKIFVLDMGEPIKILDLARQMIRLAGLQPEKDVTIEITGIRPGEKLFEEVLHDGENLVHTNTQGILLAAPRTTELARIATAIDQLIEICAKGDAPAGIEIIKAFVPEYQPTDPLQTRQESVPHTP